MFDEATPVEEDIPEEPTPAEELYAYVQAAAQVNQQLRQTTVALDRTRKVLTHEQTALKRERKKAAALLQQKSTRKKPAPVPVPVPQKQVQRPVLGPSARIGAPGKGATSIKTTIPKRKSYMYTGMPASSLPKRARRH